MKALRSARKKRGLKGYGGGKRTTVRELCVMPNEALEQLKDAWERCPSGLGMLPEEHYKAALEIVKELNYSPYDVLEFALALNDTNEPIYFREKAGIFLSALVNNGKEDDYSVAISHLPGIFYLGYRNTKNLTVRGDGAEFLGFRMESGKITVKSNAGSFIGQGMAGGEIHLEGQHGRIGKIKHGKVYSNGELIREL